MCWYGQASMGWTYIVMVGFFAVLVALLVVGVVVAGRLLGRSAPDRRNPVPLTTARHVLAQRFAHGDLDEDEYRRRLAVLTDLES